MAGVVMYSSYLCVFCWIAKAMLKKKGVQYELKGVPMIMGWKPPVKNYKEMVERTGGADYGAADFCRWGVSGG